MKINSINSINYNNNTKAVNFKHAAVPYPEYEYAFSTTSNAVGISKIIDRFLALFTPEVSEKSEQIKAKIDRIYDETNKTKSYKQNPQKQLLSVFA